MKPNKEAREGRDRCYCGCKYWEDDACIDCGTSIQECLADPEWVADNRECQGHPAGPFDPMGQTVYCDGTCR